MLLEIIKHTPAWAFVLLFVLLAFGYVQSRGRTLSRNRVAMLPAAMLAFSLFGVITAFGAVPSAVLAWAAGAASAVMLGVMIGGPGGVTYSPATQLFSVSGSWIPLALMMAIYFTKFAVGVTLGLGFPIAGEPAFADAVSLCYGGFSGIFLARAAVIWRAQSPSTALTGGAA